jgi:hypothetical protein
MDSKRHSHPDNNQDKQQLTQTIIDEMKVQGFLDELIDKETREALFEIQFSNRSMICKIEKQEESV